MLSHNLCFASSAFADGYTAQALESQLSRVIANVLKTDNFGKIWRCKWTLSNETRKSELHIRLADKKVIENISCLHNMNTPKICSKKKVLRSSHCKWNGFMKVKRSE
jgi:hypothetical protein